MDWRPYDAARDAAATHRIWLETGWLEADTDEKKRAMDIFVGCGRAFVAEVGGAAECLVLTCPGTIKYLDDDLPFGCVTGVTTSRVARKQGFALNLTAQAVAADAEDGALVAGLGMFEQGYYNRLGFGAGGYERHFSFDPATLNVAVKARPPRRITKDDWERVHAARLGRARGHGGCNLAPPAYTRAEMAFGDKGFGLGYADGPGGALSHYIWAYAKGEQGPYSLGWMAFRTGDEFLELMALIRGFGDQVRLFKMREPPGFQLQDLLDRPFTYHNLTEKSKFESRISALAYWQMRVNDVPACLARTRLPRTAEVRFNLALTDPVAPLVEDKFAWRGCGGDYVVTLGKECGAEKGADKTLPTLTAGVAAFTRMWLGVRPASGLAVTDDLAAPPDLLEALDSAFLLPEPRPDWDF